MKSYIIVTLSAVVVILLGIRGCQKEREFKDSIRTYDLLINQSKDTAKKYKDLYGNEHAYAEKLIVDKLYLQNEIYSLSKALKVKPKQIIGSTTATSTTSTTVVLKDTVDRYVDRYIEIYRSKDTFGFELKDTIVITDYWKRKWFLGRKRYFVDISNTNKYVKFQKIIAREIKGYKKKF